MPFLIVYFLSSVCHFNTVVSLLTYMLTKKELTPEEVVGVAIDVVGAGVDTVSYIFIEFQSFPCDYNMYQGR